jgi:hypothetical protein
MISIARKYRPEQTMPQSPYDAIPGQYCDFSMDRERRANFEYLSATYRLPDHLSASRQARKC